MPSMSWSQAKSQIADKVKRNTKLGREGSSERNVLEVDHPCGGYGYRGERGFLVRIGVDTGATIELPWSMLESCYRELVGGGYDGKVFRRLYPKQAKQHGCHVHVVGRLFVVAGVAVSDGRPHARYTAK